MSDFTPGECEVEMLYGDHPLVMSSERVVANCFNNEANARSIAAAPEMHHLLRCFIAIDDLKSESFTDDNNPLYMRALVEQDATVKATRALLTRIDDEDVQE